MSKRSSYPDMGLYQAYLARSFHYTDSPSIKDRTAKITLEYMNFAINNCEKWETFLDIGGGSGHFSSSLSSYFKKGAIIEVESHPEHQELIQKYSNLSVVHSLIEDYHSTEKADFILLADVFEHIPNIDIFASQLSALQEKGGVVYILTPNPNVCGPAPESEIYHTKHPHGHIKHYNKNEVCAIMARNGYESLFVAYEETPYRKATKRLLYALSRRDKRWSDNILYKLVRPILLPFYFLISLLCEKTTYVHEKRNSVNAFTTLAQAMAFKKK